jgi:hypothetical protein
MRLNRRQLVDVVGDAHISAVQGCGTIVCRQWRPDLGLLHLHDPTGYYGR